MSEHQRRVKTTETSFRIIKVVRDNEGAGTSEIARTVGLSKGAVHKHLQTLMSLGYLIHQDGGYYLSIRFLSLGIQARERLPLQPASSVVRDLADTTGYPSSFIVREHREGVYAFRATPGTDHNTDITEGDIAPLHATAGGKTILAFLSQRRRDETLDSVSLDSYTDKTITDREELEQELRSVRDQRVAFDREEYRDGLQCVASPVLNDEKHPIGAVSVSGDIHYMSGTRLEVDVTGLVTSAAKSIENKLLSQ